MPAGLSGAPRYDAFSTFAFLAGLGAATHAPLDGRHIFLPLKVDDADSLATPRFRRCRRRTRFHAPHIFILRKHMMLLLAGPEYAAEPAQLRLDIEDEILRCCRHGLPAGTPLRHAPFRQRRSSRYAAVIAGAGLLPHGQRSKCLRPRPTRTSSNTMVTLRADFSAMMWALLPRLLLTLCAGDRGGRSFRDDSAHEREASTMLFIMMPKAFRRRDG